MKIEKTLRLSYYHINYATLDFLFYQAGRYGELFSKELCVATYWNPSSDGIIVSTKHYDKSEYWDDHIDSLNNCMDYAISQGCDWICFTPDEPIIPELPVYEENAWYHNTGYNSFVGPKQKFTV